MRKICANCANSDTFNGFYSRCRNTNRRIAYNDGCNEFKYALFCRYFTIAEMCASETAKHHGISNVADSNVEYNLRQLIVNTLDPLREEWGSAIRVNSGYRCPELNKLVGGSPTSDHMLGRAADITVGSPNLNRKLFNLVQQLHLPFDQLIDERNYSWIHISYRHNANRQQILHL